MAHRAGKGTGRLAGIWGQKGEVLPPFLLGCERLRHLYIERGKMAMPQAREVAGDVSLRKLKGTGSVQKGGLALGRCGGSSSTAL